MESRIEIVGIETVEIHSQLYNKIFIFLKVFIVLIYGGYILRAWVYGGDLAYQIFVTVVFSLLGILFLQIPEWVAKRSYKNKMKYYGGDMLEVTACFGDAILLRDKDSSRTIPYEKITKIYFLPDCIAFKLGKYQIVGIPNREFTKGSMMELKQFLREKRPDLKISE